MSDQILPARKCRDWLDAYIEYTEDFEPPAEFAKWCGILALCVASGHKVWLEIANNKVWPNLYVVLVGYSGVGKGQAMREVLPFVEATKVPRSPDQITVQQMVKDMSEKAQAHPALGLITPYLLWAEELPSFLGMDAYKSGKLADLTTLYDCAPEWRSETKNNGKFSIAQPFACMLAGTTPSGIFDVMPPASVGQGFTSRLLFIWSPHYNKRIPVKPWTEKHETLRAALLHDIELIAKVEGPMRLSDLATVIWTDYYKYRVEPAEKFKDERMRGFAAREPLYVMKLATLLRLSDHSTGMEIEAHHIERAVHLVDEVGRSLKRVYEEIAPSAVIQHYPKVMRYMHKHGGRGILHSDLLKHFSYAMKAVEFRETMQGLIEMGYVKEEALPGAGSRERTSYTLTGIYFEEKERKKR